MSLSKNINLSLILVQPRKARPFITERFLMGPNESNQTNKTIGKVWFIIKVIFEPVHEISNNVVCATSKASDQPAHTRSLIRAFASRLSIL